MKKTIIMVLCVMGLLWGASNASADNYDLYVGDEYTVGTVVPGLPSSNFDDFLEHLLGMSPTVDDPVPYDGNNYFRYDIADLPDYPGPGAKTDVGEEDVLPTFTVDSILYVMGKYDAGNAGSAIWYVGGFDPADTFTIPEFFGAVGATQYRVSHYALWGGETSVPEPMSILLLGLGLVGLAGVRRMVKK